MTHLRWESGLRPFLFFSVLILTLPISNDTSADALSLAAEIGNRLRSDQVEHPTLDVGWGRATAVVNAPIGQVESTVRDYANYTNLIPVLHQSRLLTQRGDRALVYLEARMLGGALNLWVNATIVASDGPGGQRIIEARMSDGNFDVFVARWELDPLDNRTLVTFRVLADPNAPLPNRLITLGNQEAARLGVASIRQRYQ